MIFITLDGVCDYKFVILGLIREEEEDDDESFLLLHLPRKIIRYNFRDNSFNKLFNLPSSHNDEEEGEPLQVRERIISNAMVMKSDMITVNENDGPKLALLQMASSGKTLYWK
ncbi:hypothetical protein HYC85_014085 [Camellia sinensis]|uniref:Uncharacterized protein n=1 Tax=Camellia sinensis TaxID=4442 RepID=A0A7J7H8P1_CAMSI|nr:hypothetical protein HYC85_014085 [Camellia sinensis]